MRFNSIDKSLRLSIEKLTRTVYLSYQLTQITIAKLHSKIKITMHFTSCWRNWENLERVLYGVLIGNGSWTWSGWNTLIVHFHYHQGLAYWYFSVASFYWSIYDLKFNEFCLWILLCHVEFFHFFHFFFISYF